MRRAVVAIMAAALLAAPVTAETLRVEGVFAATFREAGRLPTIGVDLFDGPEGDALAFAIERRLSRLGTGRDGEGLPHPQVIAPSLRPDGLLRGRAAAAVEDFAFIETRETCAEKKEDSCVRRVRTRVNCIRRTVTLRADLNLTRRQDGRILYAPARSRSDTGSWCEDGGFGISVDAAIHAMIESVAMEVRTDLAPHREHYTVRVQEDRDGLARDLADRFRTAVRQTKRDERGACAAFAAIGQQAPDHGPTLFNRALCAEAEGRYAEAVDLYGRARVFAPGAGGEVSRGLGRTAALAAGAEDVRAMPVAHAAL